MLCKNPERRPSVQDLMGLPFLRPVMLEARARAHALMPDMQLPPLLEPTPFTPPPGGPLLLTPRQQQRLGGPGLSGSGNGMLDADDVEGVGGSHGSGGDCSSDQISCSRGGGASASGGCGHGGSSPPSAAAAGGGGGAGGGSAGSVGGGWSKGGHGGGLTAEAAVPASELAELWLATKQQQQHLQDKQQEDQGQGDERSSSSSSTPGQRKHPQPQPRGQLDEPRSKAPAVVARLQAAHGRQVRSEAGGSSHAGGSSSSKAAVGRCSSGGTRVRGTSNTSSQAGSQAGSSNGGTAAAGLAQLPGYALPRAIIDGYKRLNSPRSAQVREACIACMSECVQYMRR